MAELFDVGISIILADRISNSLMRISGGFRNADDAVRRMERSITQLTAQHELLGRKMLVNNQINQDSLALMKDRQTALLMMADTEQTVRQREQLTAQIRAAELRAAIQSEETQLRLKRMSNDLTERQIVLTREHAAAQAAASRAALMRAGIIAGLPIAAGAYGIAKLAGMGLPIGQAEAALQITGGFSKAQTRAISAQAQAISERLGMVSFQQELEMATALYKTVQPGIARRTLAPLSQAADLMALINPENTPASSVAALGQLANLMGVRDARGAMTAGTDIFNILRTGGVKATATQLQDFGSYFAGLIPGQTLAQRAQTFEALSIMSARLGNLTGAFSGRNLANLTGVLTQQTQRDLILRSMLQRFGLAHEPSGMTFENITDAVQRLERSPDAMAFNRLAGRQLTRLMTEISRVDPKVLEGIATSVKNNMTLEHAWNVEMESTQGKVSRLTTNLATLGSTIGNNLDPPLGRLADSLNIIVGDLTKFTTAHGTAITRVFAGVLNAFEAVGHIATTPFRVIDDFTAMLESMKNSAIPTAVRAITDLVNAIVALAGAVQHPTQAGKSLIGRMAVGTARWITSEVHHHVHTGDVHVHLPKGTNPKDIVKHIQEGMRRALTAAPSTGTAIPESPHLHGATP